DVGRESGEIRKDRGRPDVLVARDAEQIHVDQNVGVTDFDVTERKPLAIVFDPFRARLPIPCNVEFGTERVQLITRQFLRLIQTASVVGYELTNALKFVRKGAADGGRQSVHSKRADDLPGVVGRITGEQQ